MWADRVSNLEPLALESGAVPTALRGPASSKIVTNFVIGQPVTMDQVKMSRESIMADQTHNKSSNLPVAF